MFLDDIALVDEAVDKYGLKLPLADLGGQANPIVADYSKLPASPFIKLNRLPFAHLDPTYYIVNPELGHPKIEDLPANQFGTVLCLSVLEHVENPFEVFDGLYRTLMPGGLLILSTVFSYRFHEAPRDYWRFSPECLKMLALKAGFEVLEAGWRVRALLLQQDEYNLVRSVYLIARKGGTNDSISE